MSYPHSTPPSSRYFHIEFLKADLAQKQFVNPRYSMRAYASKIGCDPSAICRILKGKQEISLKLAKKIIGRLTIDGEEKRRFLRSVVDQQSDLASAELAEILDAKDLKMPVHELASDVYRRICDPDILSVLECHATKSPSPEQISRHLKLPLSKVSEALRCLEETRLLVPSTRDQARTKSAAQFRADPKSAPEANRRYYSKLIEKISEANASETSKARVLNGLSMLIDPERVPLAQTLISNFINDLCDLLEQGDRTHVYQLGLQLFPSGSDQAL